MFHNKEKWDKYIEEEGNQNVFFLMSSFLFDKVDFMDSLHVSSQLMSLLNSFSARKFAQLTLMQRNHSNIYSKLILDKFKNHNLVTDIVIHKYEESWGVLDNKLKRIENKKLETLSVYNILIVVFNFSIFLFNYFQTKINEQYKLLERFSNEETNKVKEINESQKEENKEKQPGTQEEKIREKYKKMICI